jgi:hypothetical protein
LKKTTLNVVFFIGISNKLRCFFCSVVIWNLSNCSQISNESFKNFMKLNPWAKNFEFE